MIYVLTESRADKYILEPLVDAHGWKWTESEYGEHLHIDANCEMLVVLGDRYGVLQAVIEAYEHEIPIAHLHGGEQTIGSLDENYRHCITKLSNLHFTATAKARQRVIQLGEHPDTVFHVGSVRLDAWEPAGVKYFETFDRPVGIVAYNPHRSGMKGGVQALIEVINRRTDVYFIISSPTESGDPMHQELVDGCRKGHVATADMGDDFLDMLSESAFILGNSSAGIIEAPHVQTPTINVGDRQAGREAGCSVLHVPPDPESISAAIDHCLHADIFYEDLYYKPGTIQKIKEVVEGYVPKTKRFYDCIVESNN